MGDNSDPIHPDVLFANRIRVKAKLAFTLSSAFIAEHDASGLTFSDMAMRLETDIAHVRRMFRLPDKAVHPIADLSLAMDFEPQFSVAPIPFKKSGDPPTGVPDWATKGDPS